MPGRQLNRAHSALGSSTTILFIGSGSSARFKANLTF
jgi:hypothetical protein